MLSCSRETKIFYLFLAAILAIHCGMMATQIRETISASQIFTPKPIKVKLVQEALRELATMQKRQIVQSEDSELTVKTKDAFLSDKDRSFERETMARSIESFKKAALGNDSHNEVAAVQKKSAAKKAFKDLKLSDFGMQAG